MNLAPEKVIAVLALNIIEKVMNYPDAFFQKKEKRHMIGVIETLLNI